VASNSVTPSAPTAPSAPTGLTATPGNGSATLSWSAPAANGSPITSYTLIPYIGVTPQTPTTVTAASGGGAVPTSATVAGLANGTTYTFTVTATNALGTSTASSPSNAVTPLGTAAPAFVQQVGSHAPGVTKLAVTPPAPLVKGNRLIVEVGVWNSANATTSSVKDAAGDVFTELLHFKAGDGTEMSIWSAPVTLGAGALSPITATPTSRADVGVAAREYSGLATAEGVSVLDQQAQASGTSKAAAVVSTPATAPTSAPGELLLGFYVDSGFGDTLMPRMGFNGRLNISPNGDMELLAEDALTAAAGATPSASVQTGASTTWLMATIVLRAAPATQAAAAPSAAPAHVRAAPGNGSATVTWTAPSNHGSPIVAYTVTPYRGARRLAPTVVSGTAAVIGGLRNGAPYRFQVRAANALGHGPASAASNRIRPQPGLVSAFWCSPRLRSASFAPLGPFG
jgi:hypothetical protein